MCSKISFHRNFLGGEQSTPPPRGKESIGKLDSTENNGSLPLLIPKRLGGEVPTRLAVLVNALAGFSVRFNRPFCRLFVMQSIP